MWHVLFPTFIWNFLMSCLVLTKLRSKLLHGVFLLAKPFFSVQRQRTSTRRTASEDARLYVTSVSKPISKIWRWKLNVEAKLNQTNETTSITEVGFLDLIYQNQLVLFENLSTKLGVFRLKFLNTEWKKLPNCETLGPTNGGGDACSSPGDCYMFSNNP